MKNIILYLSFSLITSSLLAQEMQLNMSKAKDAFAKKEYNTAIYYYNLVIEKDSMLLEAFNGRAWAFANIKDFESSLNDYNYVIKHDPSNAKAYLGVGKMKEKYEAIDYFTKAINFGTNSESKKWLGMCYFFRGKEKIDLGDKDGGLEDWQKAEELGLYGMKDMIKLQNMD
jgi:tetratricopeptide (TPR) repeat protein